MALELGVPTSSPSLRGLGFPEVAGERRGGLGFRVYRLSGVYRAYWVLSGLGFIGFRV